MSQIEVDNHSERVEMETEAANAALNVLSSLGNTFLVVYNINEECYKYTELGQAMFNDIVDVISSYIKVKE